MKMRKFLSIFFTITILLALTSCSNGVKEDTAKPSSNAEITEDAVLSETDKSEEDLTTETTTESTTSPETTKPTESNTKSNDTSQWKSAYLKYIDSLADEKSYCGYSLVYIDADNVPELFVSGSCEASGSHISSYKNGKLITVDLSRLGGASYIPKSGLIHNCNGNSGYYTTIIYRLTNSGFALLFQALNEETYEIVPNEDGSEEFMYTSKYYLYKGSNQIEVTEDEFIDAEKKIFNVNASNALEYGKYDYT